MSPTYIAAPFLEHGELMPVLKDYAIDRFNITALWPESRRGNPAVKAFVAFLGEVFPAEAAWDRIFAASVVAEGIMLNCEDCRRLALKYGDKLEVRE